MADRGSSDCSCSNIAIMQLFYELKQRYSTVPDQIVSKVIQENCHDKNACEVILKEKNRNYLQSYPGVIISGNSKETLEQKSLCNHCPKFKLPSLEFKTSDASLCFKPYNQTNFIQTSKKENAFPFSEDNGIYFHQPSGEICKKEHSKQDLLEPNAPLTSSNVENNLGANYLDVNSTTESQTSCSDCDSEVKSLFLERSHKRDLKNVNTNNAISEEKKKFDDSRQFINLPVSSSPMPVHNYQVAVQYSMQPVLPIRQGDQQRSFTTVNLNVRPPTSEPQAPIEIQSGKNLTYTSSVYDSKKGVQSQFQIMIGLGGSGTVSACRTYISSPQMRYPFCSSSNYTPHISTGFNCHKHRRLKALLEKQRERKSLLARELSKEKEKLSHMQNEVRLMKASIAQKPSPHLLPKLKAEIERLRTDCERLTAAVDLYSDKQNILPLGETDEEFYRNIYTGQTLEKQGSWSCQLCTFRNHPLLNVCEECEMPRISLGTQVMDVTSHLCNVLSNNNTSFCTGEETSTSASLITAPLQDQ